MYPLGLLRSICYFLPVATWGPGNNIQTWVIWVGCRLFLISSRSFICGFLFLSMWSLWEIMPESLVSAVSSKAVTPLPLSLGYSSLTTFKLLFLMSPGGVHMQVPRQLTLSLLQQTHHLLLDLLFLLPRLLSHWRQKIEKDNDAIRALWAPPSAKPSRQDICLKLTLLCTLSLYFNCLAETSGSSELVPADPLNLYCPTFTHYTSFYSFLHIFQCNKAFSDP